MACGHVLRHRSYACQASSSPPTPSSSTPTPTPPQETTCQAEVVIGRRYINDTCAPCDPALRHHALRAAYEHKHGVLMQQYMEAKAAGDGAEMASLEVAMHKGVNYLRRANFKASLARRRQEPGDGVGDESLDVTRRTET